MDWTDQRIELLRKLWGQGQTASQIAVALGGVSRNAVIGKAHRLGLTGRPSPIKREPGSSAQPRRRSTPRRSVEISRPAAPIVAAPGPTSSAAGPVPATPLPAQPAPQPAQRAYAPTRSHGGTKSCSWPMGDPKQPGFHFCGEPSEPGRPYCAHHCGQAYQRKSEAA